MRAVPVRNACAAFAAIVVAAACQTAQAVPILQLYVEGGTYVGGTEETWVATSTTGTFRVWAIGNVDGGGGKGTIYDVKLSIVYDSSLNPTISLTGDSVDNSMGSPFEDVIDGTATSDPVWNQTVSDGSVPKLGDGSDLPDHGEYGIGKTWQEFLLGDFTLSDESLADFGGPTFPGAFTTGGQINVYEVQVAGLSVGDSVHFDLYNHVGSGTKVKYKFAPFSHDGEGGIDGGPTINSLPEPSSLALLSIGSLGAVFAGRRRRR